MSSYSSEAQFDLEFLNEFTQGSDAGFRYLYNLYYYPLLKCSMNILQDRFAVENIVHDVFLKAWLFRQD